MKFMSLFDNSEGKELELRKIELKILPIIFVWSAVKELNACPSPRGGF